MVNSKYSRQRSRPTHKQKAFSYNPSLEAELRSQFLLRNDDVALVAYQSRKSIKRALSLLSGQPQALCWLMSA
jgi:hypothetical protein